MMYDDDFKVGDRVICVDDNGNSLCKLGKVYTVSLVGEFGGMIKLEGFDLDWFYDFRFELVKDCEDEERLRRKLNCEKGDGLNG